MSWDYRVVRKIYGDRDENYKLKEPDHDCNMVGYGIHEVFYDENDKATMCTQDCIKPYGDTVKELMDSWIQMAEAFNKPILDFDGIPEEGAINEIKQIMDDLKDEDGNMRPTEELVEEGKVIHHVDFMSSLREKFGMEDFDIKEYRNEEAVERNKAEKDYNNNLVGKPIGETIAHIILHNKDLIPDDEEEL